MSVSDKARYTLAELYRGTVAAMTKGVYTRNASGLKYDSPYLCITAATSKARTKYYQVGLKYGSSFGGSFAYVSVEPGPVSVLAGCKSRSVAGFTLLESIHASHLCQVVRLHVRSGRIRGGSRHSAGKE